MESSLVSRLHAKPHPPWKYSENQNTKSIEYVLWNARKNKNFAIAGFYLVIYSIFDNLVVFCLGF